MGIYDYEAAFGAADKTSRAMRKAIRLWFDLYYQRETDERYDPCQRIPYTVVNKLTKTVFGEYGVSAGDREVERYLTELNDLKKEAVQLALIGGECYIKPCPERTGFSFTLIPRANVLVFARDAMGEIVDIGTMETSQVGKYYYTLLERRTVDERGYLTIRNRLFRSLNSRNLGSPVPLAAVPQYGTLAECYRYPTAVGSVGLVRLKTPMVNCVDGSREGVSVYAAAVGLIRAIDRNEAQLAGEFERGQSRIVVSADLLDRGQLNDTVFVGLDDDPERVGMTIFSPALREQSFLARKQEYLRNVESVVGLKRGMLSDANLDERTATEIAASAADYNLTVMDFQTMWAEAARKVVELCACLAELYGLPVPDDTTFSIDWGNGVLYDEDKTWDDYVAMVDKGMLRPEIALGWRFGMKTDTEADLQAIRETLMPENEMLNYK